MSEKESCLRCIYWKTLQDSWKGAYSDCDDSNLADYGFCRRFPPKPTSEQVVLWIPYLNEDNQKTGENERVELGVRSEQPMTENFDWCGEFRKRSA